MQWTKGIFQCYRVSAYIVFNVCILFLAANIGIFLFYKACYPTKKTNFMISEQYPDVSFKKVYPEMNKEEINELLNETWPRLLNETRLWPRELFQYEPFTQFRERPYQGSYVNISERGFRITKNQGPWPPDSQYFNIFLFGGSTTFGYGVPDDQTIASHLQEILSREMEFEVRLYNFGRGYYYSTQERILLEQLLISGFVPDMAIFIDGLNDFFFYTVSSAEMEHKYVTKSFEKFLLNRLRRLIHEPGILESLPTGRLTIKLNSFLKKPSQIGPANTKNYNSTKDEYSFEDIAKGVIDRYLENIRILDAITTAYHSQGVFVWQPVPNFKYDLSNHLFPPLSGIIAYAGLGYPYMESIMHEKSLGNNFLWCADIQEDLHEPLYVDKVHYSSKMSRIFAEKISDLLITRNLLENPAT